MSVRNSPYYRILARPMVQQALLILVGAIAYSNTMHVPFNLDDGSFLDNKGLDNFLGSATWRDSRFFGSLTLALNYSLHGENVVGYHLVNLLIHLLGSIFLYLMVRAILQTPWFTERSDQQDVSDAATYLPFFSALLFVAHPIQTQAVTYIVQRYASLATMLSIASAYFYLEARLAFLEGKRGRIWGYGSISLLAALLAMKTKEIAIVLPLLLLILEFSFFTGSLKKRIFLLLPFVAVTVIIPLAFLNFRQLAGNGLAVIDSTARADSVIPRMDYLFTQFRVIVTYIRLLLLPVNQNLDYSYPVYQTFFTPPVFLSFIFIIMIFGTAIYLFSRPTASTPLTRLSAFGIFWFFTALLVESSVIPIIDVIFEHRVYFPSVGAAMFFGTLAWLVWQRGGRYSLVVLVGFIAIIVLLTGATYARNLLWRQPVLLWTDVTEKSPKNFRGWYNLGMAYMQKNLPNQAIKPLLRAIELNPGHQDIWESIGVALQMTRRYEGRYRRIPLAVLKGGGEETHKAWFASSYNNLGLAYADVGNLQEALSYFRKAVEVDNSLSEARYNLVLAILSTGDRLQAAAEYKVLVAKDKMAAARLKRYLESFNLRLD